MDKTTERKRLIVRLSAEEHLLLTIEARRLGITLSNLIRIRVGLPEERQGVKRVRESLGGAK